MTTTKAITSRVYNRIPFSDVHGALYIAASPAEACDRCGSTRNRAEVFPDFGAVRVYCADCDRTLHLHLHQLTTQCENRVLWRAR